jgi:hypothetical protein
MPPEAPARDAEAAFRAAVGRLYRDVDEQKLELHRADGEVGVPGFAAVETSVAGHPVRGWARDDGTVVLARRQNFGPALEALGFREEPPPWDDDQVAARLAWLHGNDFELVEEVRAGDLGLPHDLSCPPLRERRDDGALVLRLVLRKLGRQGSPAILAFAIARHEDGRYRTDVWQLAPKSDDDDDE